VAAVFLFGLLVPDVPGAAGVIGLLLSPTFYGLFQWLAPDLHFLIQVAIVFQLTLLAMGLVTLIRPRRGARPLPAVRDLGPTCSPGVLAAGTAVLVAVAAFDAVFW